ncbi:hypothetical protein ABIA33_003816 [Streptacidiphilus sp. MAP12-16]|uniref:hypothetical protein n=1 Tax=Streptacidiphilus sp. MAP12-16 TaxID=3156300 RepID=UPI003510E00C
MLWLLPPELDKADELLCAVGVDAGLCSAPELELEPVLGLGLVLGLELLPDVGLDVGVLPVVLLVVPPVVVLPAAVAGMDAISAKLPATLAAATAAVTAEVRAAPLRAVAAVRGALRAISVLPRSPSADHFRHPHPARAL